jgi:O-antigen/teichoic acid export membrane protein
VSETDGGSERRPPDVSDADLVADSGTEIPTDTGTDSAERQHLRGSSLMVVGRVISMAINLAVQVAAVRYLGQDGYGAFTYALAISAVAANIALFGQNRSLGRLLPEYDHNGEYGRARGAIATAFVITFALGMAIVLVALGLRVFGIQLTTDDQAGSLVVILVALAPLTAVDEVFQQFFAVVAKPAAIFWRRHILAPSLRLASVLAVIAYSGSTQSLAWAFLVSGAIGVLAYLALLARVMKDHRLGGGKQRTTYPVREMTQFGLPLYVSSLLRSSLPTIVVVALGALRSTADIAVFRAVVPVAMINLVGLQSFRLLYYPAASRLFVAGDHDSIRDLYWKSASWLAVGTFPIFVVTFSLARPVTEVLFGPEYSDSGRLLALISLGYYFSSTLGLNNDTLAASGRLRLLLTIDVVAFFVTVLPGIWLIERFGALGAAVATVAYTLTQDLLSQVALRRVLGSLSAPHPRSVLYLSVLVGVGLTGIFQLVIDPPLVVALSLALVVSVAVLRVNRAVLDIADVLPEVMRLPLIKFLVA